MRLAPLRRSIPTDISAAETIPVWWSSARPASAALHHLACSHPVRAAAWMRALTGVLVRIVVVGPLRPERALICVQRDIDIFTHAPPGLALPDNVDAAPRRQRARVEPAQSEPPCECAPPPTPNSASDRRSVKSATAEAPPAQRPAGRRALCRAFQRIWKADGCLRVSRVGHGFDGPHLR